MTTNKVVVCSCGHKDEINVVLTPGNEYAWTKLWESTPCRACMWIDLENKDCDIADVDVRILESL